MSAVTAVRMVNPFRSLTVCSYDSIPGGESGDAGVGSQPFSHSWEMLLP